MQAKVYRHTDTDRDKNRERHSQTGRDTARHRHRHGHGHGQKHRRKTHLGRYPPNMEAIELGCLGTHVAPFRVASNRLLSCGVCVCVCVCVCVFVCVLRSFVLPLGVSSREAVEGGGERKKNERDRRGGGNRAREKVCL